MPILVDLVSRTIEVAHPGSIAVPHTLAKAFQPSGISSVLAPKLPRIPRSPLKTDPFPEIVVIKEGKISYQPKSQILNQAIQFPAKFED